MLFSRHYVHFFWPHKLRKIG
jgi:hypothetical protein